jgi:oligopeptidase B
MIRPHLAVAAVLGLAASVAADPSPAPLQPPAARKEPHRTVLHGDTLVDDYYWLRNKGTPEVESYLRAERAWSEAFMKPTDALQKKLYDEMLGRIQQTDANVPARERGYFYYSRTEEGKQYPIFARRRGAADGPEEVILDVNALAAGKKFMSIGDMTVSPDGSLLAYTADETGFRQYTLHVKDLRTGQLGPDTAERVTSVEWTEDGKTLFYAVEHPQTKRSYQVFRHALGGTKDDLLFEEKDERFNTGVWKSRDRKYLFVESGSHTATEIRYLPADTGRGEMKTIAERSPDHEYDVDHRDGTFWIRTNDKGRNFRLVTAPVSDPARANWKEVVPHRDDVMLSSHLLFRDFYVLVEREGGWPQIRVTDFRSGQSHRVAFPEPAYQVSPSNNREFDARVVRLAYQSPITSSSIYDYDPATRQRKLLKQVAVLGGFDPSRYAVEVTKARAADGVEVPVWLVRRKDLKRDGTNPALLYAYGSYGVSMSAAFSSNLFSLVDRGMVYAIAYIRGGGELGEKWHDQGKMLSKKNTFSDFIAAAEHLVAEKYTSPNRLAIMGGSAGGLLMGAVTNMRPDLFKVVVSYVPFVDVITTMLDDSLPLTVGEFEEWGNPKKEAEYRYMKTYSPYDNLTPRAYPTMLVKSSYNDSQVMYWEPAKYVAKLRTLKTDSNPLLFHIDMDPAGHGGKSGRYDRLRETAFDYAFLLTQLGVEKVTP